MKVKVSFSYTLTEADLGPFIHQLDKEEFIKAEKEFLTREIDSIVEAENLELKVELEDGELERGEGIVGADEQGAPPAGDQD